MEKIRSPDNGGSDKTLSSPSQKARDLPRSTVPPPSLSDHQSTLAKRPEAGSIVMLRLGHAMQRSELSTIKLCTLD